MEERRAQYIVFCLFVCLFVHFNLLYIGILFIVLPLGAKGYAKQRLNCVADCYCFTDVAFRCYSVLMCLENLPDQNFQEMLYFAEIR